MELGDLERIVRSRSGVGVVQRGRREEPARNVSCGMGARAEREVWSNTPTVSARCDDAKTGPEVLEQHCREALGEDVGELLSARYLKNTKLANGHLLPHEVDVDLYVSCAQVMNWVPGHVHT